MFKNAKHLDFGSYMESSSASAVIKAYSESMSYDAEVTQEFTQNVCSPPLSSVCNMQATIDLAASWQHLGSPVSACVF